MANFSINTNVGAQVALHSLASIQTGLNRVQDQISTGYKVARAQDNAAVFAVAQGVRANLAQYDAVGTAMNNAQSLVSVAVTGVTAVSNLITGITQTLTQLADGSISNSQRRTYTANLRSQIDQVQTFITGTSYNGINILSADGGTSTYVATKGGWTAFTSAANVSVLSGLSGASLTVHAQNLYGGTAGTDGFLGLARLAYVAGFSASAAAFDELALLAQKYPYGQGADDTMATLVIVGGPGVTGGGLNVPQGWIARTELNSQAAIAALAGISGSANAFFSAATATAGTTSIFNSAIAYFTNQVNAVLGTLGADASNIQAQITFVQSLSDTARTGLGNLVDADMAQSAAQLTALQTQQQLATQALSIANAQPSNILKLFKTAG